MKNYNNHFKMQKKNHGTGYKQHSKLLGKWLEKSKKNHLSYQKKIIKIKFNKAKETYLETINKKALSLMIMNMNKMIRIIKNLN